MLFTPFADSYGEIGPFETSFYALFSAFLAPSGLFRKPLAQLIQESGRKLVYS